MMAPIEKQDNWVCYEVTLYFVITSVPMKCLLNVKDLREIWNLQEQNTSKINLYRSITPRSNFYVEYIDFGIFFGMIIVYIYIDFYYCRFK